MIPKFALRIQAIIQEYWITVNTMKIIYIYICLSSFNTASHVLLKPDWHHSAGTSSHAHDQSRIEWMPQV